MPTPKNSLYITSQQLISLLKISAQELKEIEDFFDGDPDDEWELKEGKDYRVVVKSTGLREYTESGAYCITRYVETHKKKGFLATLLEEIQEWFLHTKQKIKQSFIKSKILNNCSSLIKRNDRFFIARSDVIRIFGTRSDYLSKMDEKARKFAQNDLIKGDDYEEIDSVVYYSLTGIYKLSLALAESLSVKNRQEWCEETGRVIAPQVEDIVKKIEERDKNIQKVMKWVKEKRDKKTCQVTKEKLAPASSFKLTAHHLYSQNQYPHLADVEANLITLKTDIHDQFHLHFMGGTDKPCTIDDFLEFVQNYYPDNSALVIALEAQKLKLGEQQPLGKARSHVLYLPKSRVT